MKGCALPRNDFPPLLQVREYVNARFDATVIIPIKKNHSSKMMHLGTTDEVSCHTCVRGEWKDKRLPTFPYGYKEWCSRCLYIHQQDMEEHTSYTAHSDGTFCKKCRGDDTETVLTELDDSMSLTVRCRNCDYIVRSTTEPGSPPVVQEGVGRCLSQ